MINKDISVNFVSEMFDFLQLDSTRGALQYELNNFCYHGNILGSRPQY